MTKLTTANFDLALGSGEPGKKVRLTFRANTIDHGRGEFFYLIGMVGKIVSMPDASLAILRSVVQSLKWGADQNRTYTVELLYEFDRSWFEGRLNRCLEKIEAV